MKNLLAFGLFFIAVSSANIAYADTDLITNEELNSIEQRVNSMDYRQLNERKAYLTEEKNNLDVNTASGLSRLAAINAELSVIQKALIAIAGISAVNAITDDGYNDEIPPVITLNGDNPQTVELGTTYIDPGATANDAFHGNTAVTSRWKR